MKDTVFNKVAHFNLAGRIEAEIDAVMKPPRLQVGSVLNSNGDATTSHPENMQICHL